MATPTKKIRLSGLARRLVEDQLLDEEKAQRIFEASLKNQKPFVSLLVENKLVTSGKIAEAAMHEFGEPLVDIDMLDIDLDIVRLVKKELIIKHHALPVFRRGKRLTVAVSNPTNILALDEIKFATGLIIEAIIAEEDKLASSIEKALEAADETMHKLTSELDDLASEDLVDLEQLEIAGDGAAQEEADAVDDAPVVRFVNKLLLDAIKKGASDLHFEPYEKSYRVRFRVDGMLQEIANPPLNLAGRVAARIKIMSRLDFAERRIPQDGRIKLKISKTRDIDFRVSTCPTLFGEKVCMRILDSDSARLQIDSLGYEDNQKEIFLKNLYKPYGMFLVTGPTGSGKTVSLYTGINILNQTDVNISTVEDPVEINLRGINQVNIDERTGLDFPKALRAFLRQDPDIILVGEIRDLTTGNIAVKAVQSGHMVLSSLHTNDGPQTLTRLQDMGIRPFSIATCTNLIVAQRLVRLLIPDRRKPVKMPAEALKSEGFPIDMIEQGIDLYEPDEVTEDDPGYKGRTGIYQVMPISETTKRLIMEGANAVQLADQCAAEGIWDIRRAGLQKAANGLTSLAEVNRVTIE